MPAVAAGIDVVAQPVHELGRALVLRRALRHDLEQHAAARSGSGSTGLTWSDVRILGDRGAAAAFIAATSLGDVDLAREQQRPLKPGPEALRLSRS